MRVKAMHDMSKNPDRIPLLIKKLETAWLLMPHWRFCQFVSNLHGNGCQDIFHTEDDALEKGLDAFIEENRDSRA